MPFADSGGLKIYYEVVGQGDPLVLIQGYGQHLLHWGTLPEELAKIQYQVILIDNRGTGRSEKPTAPFTIADMADDVVKVLDALSIKRASVLGISMGGMIAQEFALNHADRLLNLILGCTFCGGSHAIAPDEGAMKLFDFEYMKSLSPEQRAKEVFGFLCSDEYIESHPEAFKYYYKVTADYEPPTYIFQRQGEAVAGFDTWERLPQIKAPTMIISGTSDRVIPFKNSEILEERIPGAELVLLQDKRHFFFLEAADSARIFVNGFLKRHGRK